jgi:GT2 family glycosyltransferase
VKIAIVILNWNGKNLLKKFIPSIIQYTDSKYAEIYVADNASTDDSISYLKEHFPTIKIIQNSVNEGFAKGYNEALKNIDVPYFALLNSDIEVTENWLDPILSHFENNPETAIVQPKILDFNNKQLFEYAGAAGGFIDKYGFAYCRGRIFNKIEKDKGQYQKNTEIFWASGACFCIRSKIFKELNGFDERYFAHFEEIDLCWRAKNLNYSIKYNSESVVYHVGGATLKVSNPKKTYLNFRNNLYTLIKNLPKKNLFSILFIRLVLDGIAGMIYLFQLKPKHTFAIVKAHFSFYKNLPENLKIRKENNLKKEKYYTTKSIIWSYFVTGKKHYSDLD